MANYFSQEQKELLKVIIYAAGQERLMAYIASSFEGDTSFRLEVDHFEKLSGAYSDILWNAIRDLTGDSVDTLNPYDVFEDIDRSARESL